VRLRGAGRPDPVSASAFAETERLVAWLRLPAIVLIGSAELLPHPNPNRPAFAIALLLYAVWSAAALVVVYLRPVGSRFALAATVVDVCAVTILVLLSGGAFSQARVAYFIVPIAVAFRFRPLVTAIAAAGTVVAYLAQALVHPAAGRPEAIRFVALFAGFLAWVGLAAVLLSAVLARRTRRIADLAAMRERLLADTLNAEERERKALAEGLHDHAIQNLLSARHDVEEAAQELDHPALRRAEETLGETLDDLREAIFELHPQVLDAVGLAGALPAVAERAARRGGFRVHFELRSRSRHPQERLLLAVAGELLANVAEHAEATDVTVTLADEDGEVVLRVDDDGRGFRQADAGQLLGAGHIGLATHGVRVESAGGRLVVRSAPGAGTTAEVRLPR
jgi:two-component system NarL family sensor kinase